MDWLTDMGGCVHYGPAVGEPLRCGCTTEVSVHVCSHPAHEAGCVVLDQHLSRAKSRHPGECEGLTACESCPDRAKATVRPQPSTLNSQPSTLHSQPSTLMDRTLLRSHWQSDESLILTAADEAFLPGAYLALATARRFNKVPMACCVLGVVDPQNEFLRRIAAMAEIVHFPEVGRVHGWQTWHKPRFIQWGLARCSRVIWLDADTTTGGSLEPLSRPGIFVPDHGFYTPTNNANKPEFYSHMPPPRRKWQGQWPCAGVLGFSTEHGPLVAEWRERCDRAIATPVIESSTLYYDQGILQDLLDCDLADGRVWNNLQSRRVGTLKQILEDSTRYSVIMHFGGLAKPWKGWPGAWPEITALGLVP